MVSHVYREGNTVADALAKNVGAHDEPHMYFEDPPLYILDLLTRDKVQNLVIDVQAPGA